MKSRWGCRGAGRGRRRDRMRLDSGMVRGAEGVFVGRCKGGVDGLERGGVGRGRIGMG